jgi:hypothetical protein
MASICETMGESRAISDNEVRFGEFFCFQREQLRLFSPENDRLPEKWLVFWLLAGSIHDKFMQL